MGRAGKEGGGRRWEETVQLIDHRADGQLIFNATGNGI